MKKGVDRSELVIPDKVEAAWEMSPHLPLDQRLNAAFETISVSAFPRVVHGEVIEIASDASISDAVQILATNNILSAPVRDVTAPPDASWIDRYLGIADFAGIILWLLQQTKTVASGIALAATGTGAVAGGIAGTLGAALCSAPMAATVTLASAAGALYHGSNTAAAIGHSGSHVVDCMGGNFFETLTSSDFYRKSQVKDIVGSFRWAPFLPVQESDTLLTVLLLLSKYRMKSLPVVEAGESKILNFITQSSVIHILSKCSGLPWFDTLGNLPLSKLRLPLMMADRMIKLEDDHPVLDAFELMKEHGIGGVPIVHKGENKPIANISIRDVRFLLTAPEIYKNRAMKIKDFLEATKDYLQSRDPSSPFLKQVVTCSCDTILKDVISKLDQSGIHRIYVVDADNSLEGVVTLRDIISKFVYEPRGYFGDFFAGVVPARSF